MTSHDYKVGDRVVWSAYFLRSTGGNALDPRWHMRGTVVQVGDPFLTVEWTTSDPHLPSYQTMARRGALAPEWSFRVVEPYDEQGNCLSVENDVAHALPKKKRKKW